MYIPIYNPEVELRGLIDMSRLTGAHWLKTNTNTSIFYTSSCLGGLTTYTLPPESLCPHPALHLPHLAVYVVQVGRAVYEQRLARHATERYALLCTEQERDC